MVPSATIAGEDVDDFAGRERPILRAAGIYRVKAVVKRADVDRPVGADRRRGSTASAVANFHLSEPLG